MYDLDTIKFLFWVYSLVGFDKSVNLCNYHPSQNNIFNTPKSSFMPRCSKFLVLFAPSNHWSDFRRHGTCFRTSCKSKHTICVWLSFSLISLRFIHLICVLVHSSLLLCGIHCISMSQFVYSSACWWAFVLLEILTVLLSPHILLHQNAVTDQKSLNIWYHLVHRWRRVYVVWISSFLRT